MYKFGRQKEAAKALTEAMKGNDETQITKAWQLFHEAVVEKVREDFEELQESNDSNILGSRGYRQLTAKETSFYQKLIDSAKSANPKQAFTDLITTEAMPNSIIEDVYRDMQTEHPLLAKINFQHVQYLTKWILNDHTEQTAVWGKITDEITKKITSAFRVIDVDQAKLSAYAIIEKGMLDLGPTFLDNYIRTILKTSLLLGLESGIISGNGVNCPIGLNRDVHTGVSVSSTDGYPKKKAIKVTAFTPQAYGELVAKLSTNERGRKKKFTSVSLICNQTDYLTKVMPATTVLNASGTYVNNLFPFATDVIISNEMPDGEAILCLPEEYFFGVGGSKEGVIEYTDELKFLEDQRVYKIKQYAKGTAHDDTTAILLDIKGLDPAYITIMQKTDGVATA